MKTVNLKYVCMSYNASILGSLNKQVGAVFIH